MFVLQENASGSQKQQSERVVEDWNAKSSDVNERSMLSLGNAVTLGNSLCAIVSEF